MKLSVEDRQTLNKMIKAESFFGLPLSEVTPDLFDALDEDDIRTLFIITSMLHWDCMDSLSGEFFPEDAANYLKKFTLKK